MLRALATASCTAIEPELTGLMLLRSILPELLGCGMLYGTAATGGPAGGYEGG